MNPESAAAGRSGFVRIRKIKIQLIYLEHKLPDKLQRLFWPSQKNTPFRKVVLYYFVSFYSITLKMNLLYCIQTDEK